MEYPRKFSSQSGFGMLEVLVALIILLIGLLGLAGLMAQSQRSEMESYQRVQALVLLQDMAGRINANRGVAPCYAFTNTAAGTPNLGTDPTLPDPNPPACGIGTAGQQAQYAADMASWHNALLGTTEAASGGGNVGAMIGARGCVSYDAATELVNPTTGLNIAGTGIYTIAVAWQGLGDTFAVVSNTPAMKCGQNQYGSETRRRVVSLTLRTASLAAI